nr:hypothetical protein [Tanacetum cinerariifolium]
MAFMSSSNNNSSSNNGTINNAQAVNTANGVSTASTQVNIALSINIDNLSDAVICSFFASQPSSPQLRIGRKLTVNGNETTSFNKSNVKCYNCHKMGHFAREFRAPRNQDNKYKETSKRSVPMETPTSTALVPFDNCEKGLGYENYNTVLLLYTGNFLPSTPDLSYTSLDKFANKTVVKNKSSEEETKLVRKDALIIEEWVSYNEEENVSQPKIEKKIVSLALLRKSLSNPYNKKRLLGKLLRKLRTIGKTVIDLEAIKETRII